MHKQQLLMDSRRDQTEIEDPAQSLEDIGKESCGEDVNCPYRGVLILAVSGMKVLIRFL